MGGFFGGLHLQKIEHQLRGRQRGFILHAFNLV